MIETQRTVYRCEYCKKNSLSKGHMRKHEQGCTKNPDRQCGWCLRDFTTQRLDPPLTRAEVFDNQEGARGRAMLFYSNCPGCMMAEIRQADDSCAQELGWDYLGAIETWREQESEVREEMLKAAHGITDGRL